MYEVNTLEGVFLLIFILSEEIAVRTNVRHKYSSSRTSERIQETSACSQARMTALEIA